MKDRLVVLVVDHETDYFFSHKHHRALVLSIT